MSNLTLTRLLSFNSSNHRSLILSSFKRFKRTPFGQPPRSYEERNRVILNQHRDKRLELADFVKDRPGQFKLDPKPKEPIIKSRERKLASLAESKLPYEEFTESQANDMGTWYDPLFNPHLHEERNKVNPEEEPFNAIYADSKSELANEYTKVRNITTPELWDYVERLARIKIAPSPQTRKANEPITALPSGFIPPPETPPDLPYFIPRTRNYVLPVYYRVHSDPEECYTMVKQITGDLWKFEEDLRGHLESLNENRKRILTSVQETDARVLFRGKHLKEIADWLHQQGF